MTFSFWLESSTTLDEIELHNESSSLEDTLEVEDKLASAIRFPPEGGRVLPADFCPVLGRLCSRVLVKLEGVPVLERG